MNDSIIKTLSVAFAVCLVCSLFVSFAAVNLRETQNLNKINDQRVKVLQAAGIYDEANTNIEEQFSVLEAMFIDFSNNEIVSAIEGLDLDSYDPVEYSRKDGFFTAIPNDEDIAIVKNKENYGKIFILRDENNSINKVVLPIRGYGLWGTLYGYLALEGDLTTISGIGFYNHKETPGLGGEVDNSKWKASWKGVRLYDLGRNPSVALVKTRSDSSSENAEYEVDALSGATFTTRGVENLVNFWTGEFGFGNFIERLRVSRELAQR